MPIPIVYGITAVLFAFAALLLAFAFSMVID